MHRGMGTESAACLAAWGACIDESQHTVKADRRVGDAGGCMRSLGGSPCAAACCRHDVVAEILTQGSAVSWTRGTKTLPCGRRVNDEGLAWR